MGGGGGGVMLGGHPYKPKDIGWVPLNLRGCVRNLKMGVQVFGPVKQKPVVGGNPKGHVDPLPYPPPSDTKILDKLILHRLLLTLFYYIVVALRLIHTYYH